MRIVVSEFMSLDGVVQAPGGREEDTEDDLDWTNTSLLPPDDALGAVQRLRDQPGGDINVMGSASLVAQLVAAGLVDEYRLMIEPIILGGGKSIFPSDGEARPLELISSKQTSTGVHVCTYRPTTT